jgi:TonB-dependent SusC/RagA subfamily outer membrane receptor
MFLKNPPLIVLDGEALPANFNMSILKPESIEKIEVLKDASATAIYGEKGKNGVIIITSKK